MGDGRIQDRVCLGQEFQLFRLPAEEYRLQCTNVKCQGVGWLKPGTQTIRHIGSAHREDIPEGYQPPCQNAHTPAELFVPLSGEKSRLQVAMPLAECNGIRRNCVEHDGVKYVSLNAVLGGLRSTGSTAVAEALGTKGLRERNDENPDSFLFVYHRYRLIRDDPSDGPTSAGKQTAAATHQAHDAIAAHPAPAGGAGDKSASNTTFGMAVAPGTLGATLGATMPCLPRQLSKKPRGGDDGAGPSTLKRCKIEDIVELSDQSDDDEGPARPTYNPQFARGSKPAVDGKGKAPIKEEQKEAESGAKCDAADSRVDAGDDEMRSTLVSLLRSFQSRIDLNPKFIYEGMGADGKVNLVWNILTDLLCELGRHHQKDVDHLDGDIKKHRIVREGQQDDVFDHLQSEIQFAISDVLNFAEQTWHSADWTKDCVWNGIYAVFTKFRDRVAKQQ